MSRPKNKFERRTFSNKKQYENFFRRTRSKKNHLKLNEEDKINKHKYNYVAVSN